MNIKSNEKKEKRIVELIVEVGKEEFDSAVSEVFRKSRNSISVPGFRKGKAPRKIVERMYGASVFHSDALDIVLPKVLQLAVEETDLKIVGYPQIMDVDIKEEGGLDVTIAMAEYPEVMLGEYKGLSAVKPKTDVPESEIDSEIAGIRLRNARIETAERPAINGDTATIDYEGFLDGEAFEGGKGEDYDLELGSNTFIPGFEQKIQGMTIGEERDIDLVFPDNYMETLAGKAVVFKVKLKDLKEKILPDVDDEFAKDVSEFDTLDEYKASIRGRLLAAKQSIADQAFENALMEKLVEAMEGEIPDVMIEEQLENSMNNFTQQISAYGMDPAMYLRMNNMTPETFSETMRASSEIQVKTVLALDKIAELEGIEVSEEDVESEYEDAAEKYGMEVDKLKESVAAETITREIKLKRAAKIVIDSAIAEDPPIEDKPEDSEKPAEDEGAKKKTKAPTAAGAKKQDKTDEPTTDAEKPKKPTAKKTSAKKTDANIAADTPQEEPAQQDAEPPKKPAAKKAPPKKPKSEDADTTDTPQSAEEDAVPEKKPAARKPRKPKTEDAEPAE